MRVRRKIGLLMERLQGRWRGVAYLAMYQALLTAQRAQAT